LGVGLGLLTIVALVWVFHRIAHWSDPMVTEVQHLRRANDELASRLAKLEIELAKTSSGGSTRVMEVDSMVAAEDDVYNVRLSSHLTSPIQPVGSRHKEFYGTFEVQPLSLRARVRYLELKTNARMNWANHYNLDWIQHPHECKNIHRLKEFDPKCDENNCDGIYDQPVCLDDFTCQTPQCRGQGATTQQFSKAAQPPCLVYDFGIREQPELGVRFAKDFGCEVHAFDPSPISTAWWERVREEFHADIPNYHFHNYGAAGRDGDVTLFEYNWGQVSMMQYPLYINHTSCIDDGRMHCRIEAPRQSEFKLPVRTLMSVMRELGHKHISVLKIDAEGAEYAFLEQAFDTFGCLPIDQISLEWHHFSLDSRYGQGSSPEINTLVTLMHRCGFRQVFKSSTWTSPDAVYHHMGMSNMRYNIALFKRI